MKNEGQTREEDADGLDARNDAALWEALGRTPTPQASPYFARRVLREVGLHEKARPTARGARWWQPAALWRACRRLPQGALVAGAAPLAALLALFVGLHLRPLEQATMHNPEVANVSVAAGNFTVDVPDQGPSTPGGANVTATALPEEVSAQDVEVIADLDNLLKREESRLWTEDDTTARF